MDGGIAWRIDPNPIGPNPIGPNPVGPNPIGHEPIPRLDATLRPPLIQGIAALAHRVYAGAGLDDLLAAIPEPRSPAGLLDTAYAHRLRFRARAADARQAEALRHATLFRITPWGAPGPRPLHLLALVAPGDLMANTPLEFITAHLDVTLDLLFVVPDQPLPATIPDHDIAFCAVGAPDAAMTRRLRALHDRWPRPMLNDPAAIARLARDRVAATLADCPAILAPRTARATRRQLTEHLAGIRAIPLLADAHPVLLRPLASHAGDGLVRLDWPDDLAPILADTEESEFFLTRFVDYSGPDGLFRKYRIALIEGRPFLCHMAVSDHWMVHYLNADMDYRADRRAEEARAMARFAHDFALRHARAFAWITERLGLDYLQIDCAEARDGRLLVFEVDVAAIVHLMDPPDPFAYKQSAMRTLFDAFETTLRRRAH